MGDKEDQETMLEEMDAHQVAAKTAWVRAFIPEASKRRYTRQDIIALLDEPGMTVEAVVQRILSTRKPRLAPLRPTEVHFAGLVAKRGLSPVTRSELSGENLAKAAATTSRTDCCEV